MANFSPLRTIIGVAILTFLAVSEANADALVGIDNSGNLYNISLSDASLTLIGRTTILSPAALETAPDGTLYAFSIGGTLYKINPKTGFTTLIGPLNLPGFFGEGSLVFSPAGIAYGSYVYGDAVGGRFLFTINLATGAATIGARLDESIAFDINGMLWRSDGKLVGIERTSNSLLEINPSSGFTSIVTHFDDATLGGVGGMTMLDGVAYFSTANTTGSAPGTNDLFRFDPFTGEHTRVGSFGTTLTNAGISGLAAVPVPEASPGVLTVPCAGLLFGNMRRRKLSRT